MRLAGFRVELTGSRVKLTGSGVELTDPIMRQSLDMDMASTSFLFLIPNKKKHIRTRPYIDIALILFYSWIKNVDIFTFANRY